MANLIPGCKSQPCACFSYLALTAAENHWQFVLLATGTLSQVEKRISETHTLLASSHRFDPRRPAHLQRLGVLRTIRDSLSPNKDDLDKSITHFTEAILFPFQSSHDVVHLLFHLANVLHSRSVDYKQLEDAKSSAKYFHLTSTPFNLKLPTSIVVNLRRA